MATITNDQTIAAIVIESPRRAKVFERFGIDYCCGGKKPLKEACSEKSLDYQAVVEELRHCDEEGGEIGRMDESLAQASISQLIENIVNRHHAYLRHEMPRLEALAEKVARVHGERHPELKRIQAIVRELFAELAMHMFKEEEVLFPYGRRLDGPTAPAPFHCGGSVAAPVSVMEAEHEYAGRMLAALKELSDGYTPPADACNSYRALYAGLADVEADLHMHIHKENHLLHPKMLEAEKRCRPS